MKVGMEYVSRIVKWEEYVMKVHDDSGSETGNHLEDDKVYVAAWPDGM
ncbi:MAG: hypothetical protein QME66_06040 [Candidatus Eisenbacteria bacterium]|nr:hypothetical protein [Candidatus Eisenbacteria bacterium]